MTDQELASTILQLVGGEENVNSLKHCATRLRFKIKDMGKVDQAALNATEGVAGTKEQEGGIQVIIGVNVQDIYDEIYKIATFSEAGGEVPDDADAKKGNIVTRILNTVTDIMVPILPMLVATGLTGALKTLIAAMGVDTASTFYLVIDLLATAPMAFLPFMVASSAAQKFKVNPYISMGTVAILLHSSFSSLGGEGASYAYLFNLIPIRIVDYSSSIVPAILMCYFQQYVEKFYHKYIPKVVSVFLEPLLTFLTLSFLLLTVFGPIGAYIGDGITWFINLALGNFKWLICGLLGAFGSLIVATGMHYSMMSFIIANFVANGYDNFYAGQAFAGAMALAGAVLAVAVKAKSANVKQVASSTGLTALLGISEPALYGMFLPYRSVMISAMIAGGIGGMLSGIIGVNSYGMAPAGLTSVAIFVGDTFWHAIICMALSFVLGFALSYILWKEDDQNA